MKISTSELALARETLNGLLDELGIPAYRFDIEPREESWLVTIECQSTKEWHTVTLDLPRAALHLPSRNPDRRRELMKRLDEVLSNCLRVV